MDDLARVFFPVDFEPRLRELHRFVWLSASKRRHVSELGTRATCGDWDFLRSYPCCARQVSFVYLSFLLLQALACV